MVIKKPVPFQSFKDFDPTRNLDPRTSVQEEMGFDLFDRFLRVELQDQTYKIGLVDGVFGRFFGGVSQGLQHLVESVPDADAAESVAIRAAGQVQDPMPFRLARGGEHEEQPYWRSKRKFKKRSNRI